MVPSKKPFFKKKKKPPPLQEEVGGKRKAASSAAFHPDKKRHSHTAVARDLSVAAKPGRMAKVALWDLSVALPKWAEAVPVDRKTCVPPASALALEIEGAHAVDKLRHRLLELARQHKGNVTIRSLTFERWRFAATWEEQTAAAAADTKSKKPPHPLLPSQVEGNGGPAALGLMDDLQWQGLTNRAAQEVAATLRAEAAAEAAKLGARRQQALSGKPASLPPVELTVNRHSLDLTCGKKFAKVSVAAYGKLCQLHRRHAPAHEATPTPPAAPPRPSRPSDDGWAEPEPTAAEAAEAAEAAAAAADDGARSALHQRVLALLLRYKTLLGHGYQAAIGPPVWRVLQARLGVGFECFASPLNCYLPRFCSGFADVDGPFGSAGSFFSLRPQGGSFAANPPFVDCIMDAAAEHALGLLRAAEQAAGASALSFVVVLPGWSETAAYTQLSASPLLRRRVLVAAADHGYCDGAAHQRQDPFRESPYDTAVFVLQTDKAARKWPATDAFEAELRAAFAACVPTEAALQRQSGSNAPAGAKAKRPRGRGGEEEARGGAGGAGGAGGEGGAGGAGRARRAADELDHHATMEEVEELVEDEDDAQPVFRQLLAAGEGAPRNPRLDYARPNRRPGQASSAKGKDGVFKDKAARDAAREAAREGGRGGKGRGRGADGDDDDERGGGKGAQGGNKWAKKMASMRANAKKAKGAGGKKGGKKAKGGRGRGA